MNKTSKNKLIKDLENQNNQNDEMEFEDYISKLNSGDFNIDEQLSDRPLLCLINKYIFSIVFIQLTFNFQKFKTSFCWDHFLKETYFFN